MIKMIGLSHLFKWENLHNWWLTKYFFAPLYISYLISPAYYLPYVFLSFIYLQLPHGLPPTSVGLEAEVEKRFLRDPAWLPIPDTAAAFHRFLK